MQKAISDIHQYACQMGVTICSLLYGRGRTRCHARDRHPCLRLSTQKQSDPFFFGTKTMEQSVPKPRLHRLDRESQNRDGENYGSTGIYHSTKKVGPTPATISLSQLLIRSSFLPHNMLSAEVLTRRRDQIVIV